MNKRSLAIIPARGGSKGVPRKNIRLVAGRPLIAYTIEAAKASRCLTRFVISTEDVEIAAVARSLGCEVVERPVELAYDDTPMVPVVQHALAHVERNGDYFDYIVVLQPTSPLRTGQDIDAALTRLIEAGADSIVSVYQVGDAHPARMYYFVDGYLSPYEQEPSHRLRQKMPPVYLRNGAIYACHRDVLVGRHTLIGERPLAYIMSRENSINIDDELDLLLADMLLRRRQKRVSG